MSTQTKDSNWSTKNSPRNKKNKSKSPNKSKSMSPKRSGKSKSPGKSPKQQRVVDSDDSSPPKKGRKKRSRGKRGGRGPTNRSTSGSPKRESQLSAKSGPKPEMGGSNSPRRDSSLNPNASVFVPGSLSAVTSPRKPGDVRGSAGSQGTVGSFGSKRSGRRSPRKPKISFNGVAPPIEYDVTAGWTIYWNPPTTLKHSTHNDAYVKGLKELQTFGGIKDFWSKAAELQKPSRVHHGAHNFMMFRKGLVPAWESFPCGGAWIVNYPRGTTSSLKIDSVWETIMFNLVAEGFGSPEVVGASLHIRDRGYRLCVWNRDNRIKDVRFSIADKLRMLLSIHQRQEVHYKFFAKCLQDGSTTSRATPYQFIKVKI